MELNKNLRKWGYKISSGDVFEVPLNNNRKGYFQFLFKDDFHLAGHLIRAFDLIVENTINPELIDIISSNVKFHSNTRVLQGLRDKLWNKIGNVELPADFEKPYLKYTTDNCMGIEVSENWTIVQAGTDFRKFIGKLDNVTRKLDDSGVFPPFAIVQWLETGWHGFKKPE